MGFFSKKTSSSTKASERPESVPANENASYVQVMGTGCKKCHSLYESAVQALGEGSVEYVTDMARIAEAGVMTLPALVVDGKVVSAGRILSPDEVRDLV